MRGLGLVAVAVTAASAASPKAHAQSEEQSPEVSEIWRVELESGCRAWGRHAYRGLNLAPGLWYEIPPGIDLGLFVPVHFRVGDQGRNGVDLSVGIEPRFRFLIADRLRGELAFGIAAEDQEWVHGIYSYSAGVNVNKVVSMRFTHERYRLEEALEEAGAAASANYVDLVFTGDTGKAVALAESAVVSLLLVVTAGAY